jgi:hypothetical protein
VERDLFNSTIYHFLYSNPTDKGQCHLKYIKLRYSQKLESLIKDLWLFSYEFTKFVDLEKEIKDLLKKTRAGQI